jgi:hypothetical protein
MMAKEGEFGGYPDNELTMLYGEWASTARPASFTDAQWIAKLVEKVEVLHALAKEEHAAANAGDTVDIVAVAMKCMDVRTEARGAITNPAAGVAQLKKALNDLETLWGK